MSIADKLRKVLEIKNDIKASLEEVGVEVTDDFSTYATEISNLSSGSGEPEIPSFPDPPVIEIPELPSYEDVVASIPPAQEPEPWTRPEEWINLEEKIERHSYEECPYRVALLLQNDESSNIKLGYYTDSYSRNTTMCKYITVDDGDRGFEYEFIEGDPSYVTHEWGDYSGTNGFRWVIYHFDTQNINFTSIPSTCVQIIFDGVVINPAGRSIYYSYEQSTIGSRSGNIKEMIGLNGAKISSSGCSGITKLEYFTPSLLQDCTNISFRGCSSLKYIPEEVDFSSCTSFSYMFQNCSSLTTIPELNTTNGTNFSYMFNKCSSLTSIPLIDTTNGTNFGNMFDGCTSLTTIPLIDITNGTNFSKMFQNCCSLVTIPELDFSSCTSFSSMFNNCSSLVTIPELNTTNGTNFSYMFNNCSSLVTIPINDISKVTSSSYVSNMFRGCISLVTIPEELINSIKINVDKLSLFAGCPGITYLPLIVDNYTTSIYTYLGNFKKLETIVGLVAPNSNTALNLSSFNNLKYIGNLDLPKCVQYKFPKSLIYIKSVDFSSSTNLQQCFSECSSLVTILELNTTTNVTDFSYMFNKCSSLTSIPLIDTTNGTNFSSMFDGCTSLTTIPELNTTNGTNFRYMFDGCTSLTTIPELNTTNGTDFSFMFNNCSSLVTIPELNTTNGTNFSYMFSGCTSLERSPKLYLGKASSIASSTSFLFSGCKSLKYLSMIEAPIATTFQNILGGDNYDPKEVIYVEEIEGIKVPNATGVINLSNIGDSYLYLQYGKVRYIGDIDISSCTSSFNIPGIYNLTSISFIGTVKCKLGYFYSGLGNEYESCSIKNFKIEVLDYSQDFSRWKCLTKQSLLNILNALVTLEEGTTKTLTLHTTYHMSKLTDEEKAIAINKGWTLSESNT